MKNIFSCSTRLAFWIIRCLFPEYDGESMEAQYEEVFNSLVAEKGSLVAQGWLWGQLARSLPGLFSAKVYWGFSLLKSYFKIAVRYLWRQKLYTLINILGLAVGMAGFTLLAVHAGVKLRADEFHRNGDRIFSLIQQITDGGNREDHTAFLPVPLGPALKSEFPDIDQIVRVVDPGRLTMKRDGSSFYENEIVLVDPEFLSVFSFEMKAGNPASALTRPNTMVLTENSARKYFGSDDPVGRTLMLESGVPLTITGILKNINRTSSLKFEFLVSLETAGSLGIDLDNWDENRAMLFLLLNDVKAKRSLEDNLWACVSRLMPDTGKSLQRVYLFPYLDFRLKAVHITSLMHSSYAQSPYIILFMSILLLLVVSVNFINLSTARYMSRVKEVGLRKVIGARRAQLMKQFLGESVLVSFLALPLAILIYELSHPLMASFYAVPLQVSNSIVNYPFLLEYLVFVALIIGLFSGFYPALYLSAFKPIQILRGSVGTGKKRSRGTKTLIVVQFTVSIIFLIFAEIIQQQADQFSIADMGYQRQQVGVVEISGKAAAQKNLLMDEIRRRPEVVIVSSATGIPGLWSSPVKARFPDVNESEGRIIQAYGVGYGFIEALGMQMIQGRSLNKDRGDAQNLVINESAARMFNLNDPLGKQLVVGDRTGTVVGVVKDFIFGDIGFNIPPAALFVEPENVNFLYVKYSPAGNFKDIQDFIREQWLILTPDVPFNCYTLTESYEKFMELLFTFAEFLQIMGFTAIFFSCLGLFGMASYVVQRRTKEIGVRKILGASTRLVTWSLIRQFLLLVTISNAIALPLAYLVWDQVERTGLLFITGIKPGTFFFAAGTSLFIAVIATGSQALKAARSNPVKTLRYE